MIFFAAPIWLALMALAIPVLAYHARRRRTLQVPSAILWRQVAGNNRARARFALPRLNWLLVLQLLGLAALALALAQPYWGKRASDQAVYLVDISGPMQAFDEEGKTRIAAARELVADSMSAALLDGAEVTIIAVGDKPFPIASRHNRRGGLMPLLSLLQAEDGIADWQSAFALAANMTQDAGDVTWHLVTPEMPALPETSATVRHLPPRVEVAPSLGLSGNAAPELPDQFRPRPEGGALMRISGRVTATDGAELPDTLPLRFHPYDGGPPQYLGRLGLAPTNDPVVMQFSSVQSIPAAGMLEVTLPDDATPHDNVLVFDTLIKRPSTVLLVQNPAENGADDPIKRALGAVFGQVDEAASLPATLSNYDAVIVNDIALQTRPTGNVLWLNGAGLSGETAPPDQTARLDGWTQDHPATASLPFSRHDNVVYKALPPLDGAYHLASVGDQPVISARRLAQGVEMRATIDPVASGWTDGDMFIRLLMRFADWAAIGPKGMTACNIGGACRLPAHLALQDITGPDGTARNAMTLPPDTIIPESAAAFSPSAVGLYHLSDGRTLVVRKPENIASQSLATEDPQPAPHSLALAPWLLLFAILVLVAEAARARYNGHRKKLPYVLRGLAVVALVCAYIGLALPRIANVPLVHSVPDGALADNLLTSLAETPADAPVRLQYSGDGFDPANELANALPLLNARQIPLDVVATPPAPLATVTIQSLDLPPQARVGDAVPVTLQVMNPQDNDLTLPFTLMVNGEIVVTEDHTFSAGLNRIDAEVMATEEGMLRLTATIGQDIPPARAAIPVASAPKALIIARNTSWGAYLAEALALQGIDVEVALPARAPLVVDEWLERDLIILADVSATALTYERMAQIETAVRDHGRGLMILGGDNAFAGGGYFATPLEALSPLSAKVPQDAPLASIVFVVDRSGSMLTDAGGGSRLDVARVATVAAARSLDQDSLLSIVAFDARPHLMLPLTQGASAEMLEDALRQVNPGGGTAVLPALDMAIEALAQSDLPLRHIIVMTDGQVENYPFDEIIARAQEAGITVSSVGIGEQGRTAALMQLAEQGGGTFHFAQDIRALPSIAAQEAMSLAGNPAERGTFTPYWTSDQSDPKFAGLPETLPPLEAFIKTTLREGADLHLAVHGPDGEVPIMATWPQGAGQVLAFAGPAAGGGAQAWMADPAYPRFWAQIARQMVSESAPVGLSVSTTRVKDRLIFDMTRLLPVDPFLHEDPSGLARLTLTAPDGTARQVVMARTGDFTWRGEAAVDQAGHWQINARHGMRETHGDIYIGALSQPHDPQGDIAALIGFAAMTGGESLHRAVNVNDIPSSWRWYFDPARNPWIVIALLLVTADLVARYRRRKVQP